MSGGELTDLQRCIVESYDLNPNQSAADIASRCDCSESHVRRTLKDYRGDTAGNTVQQASTIRSSATSSGRNPINEPFHGDASAENPPNTEIEGLFEDFDEQPKPVQYLLVAFMAFILMVMAHQLLMIVVF